MANLKEVRTRISSVKNTQQITKAMKMVAAAKLRRAQDAITRMRPYAKKQNAMLRNILSNLDGNASSAFSVERPVNSAAVVVVTSNRGLAGAFNTNIIKAAVRAINGPLAEAHRAGKLDIICIGKKGYDFFKKRYDRVDGTDVALFNDLTFENGGRIAQMLMDRFENGQYDAVYVAFSEFKNAATQLAQGVQWLPVQRIEAEGDDGGLKADYIFEPNKEELLDYLIPSILKTTFYRYVLDVNAAEHGARMTAMDKATENAQELLGDLKLAYNKARQEAITNEISEIVGGAAALEAA